MTQPHQRTQSTAGSPVGCGTMPFRFGTIMKPGSSAFAACGQLVRMLTSRTIVDCYMAPDILRHGKLLARESSF